MKRIDILIVVLFTCLAPLGRLQAQTLAAIDAPGAGSVAGQGTVVIGMNQERSLVGYYIDARNAHHRFVRDRHGTFTTSDPAGSSAIDGHMNAAGTSNELSGNAGNVDYGCMPTRKSISNTLSSRGGGAEAVQIAAGMGTFYSFNPGGPFAGSRGDARTVLHGYFRGADGTITEFDAPGAGTGEFQGTLTCSINPEGVAAGHYIDRNDVLHGYVRTPGGSFTTYDAPSAGTNAGQGTVVIGMNSAGIMMGYYIDADGVSHGFLRARTGRVTEFDAPPAGSGTGQGTVVLSINPAGAMMGYYVDGNGVSHGFLREP